MTINRVKPSGWSANEKLTAAQITAVDTNGSYGLDKRSGETDTLQSTITVDSSGSILVTGTGNKIVLNAAGKIVANASGSQILANASGSKIITANGGVFEIGGSTDFPQFTTSRNKSIMFNHSLINYYDGCWGDDGAGESIVDACTDGIVIVEIPTHDGATLTSVDMFYIISSSHFPQFKMNASVERFDATTNTGITTATAFTQYVTGTNAATYYNGGAVQTFTYLCDQNNVAGPNYRFNIYVEDEFGTGALSGNRILGWRANWTNITDMRFA